MILKYSVFFVLCVRFTPFSVMAQQTVPDTIQVHDSHALNYKALIIPAAFTSYGVIGLESENLKFLNGGIKMSLTSI